MQTINVLGICFLSITSLIRCGGDSNSAPFEPQCGEGFVLENKMCVKESKDRMGFEDGSIHQTPHDGAIPIARDAAEIETDATINDFDAAVDQHDGTTDNDEGDAGESDAREDPLPLDQVLVKIGNRYEIAPDDVVISFGGRENNRWVRVSNYCGAPDSQRWNIPCEYDGIKIVFAVSSNATRAGTLGLTVMGDHDSDPLGEDDEFIHIFVDETDLGQIFDHNTENDRFSFTNDRGNLSQTVIASEASLTRDEIERATVDGHVEIVLDYLGGSHDDYTPYSHIQEYFEIRLSY